MLFRVNPQLNRYDATRIASFYDQMIERLQAVPGVRAVTLRTRRCFRAASTRRASSCRAVPISHGADQQRRQSGQGRVAEFLRDDGDSAAAGRGFTAARQPARAAGRDHQRGRGAQVLPERRPARPAIRQHRREQQPDRDRRRRPRREYNACATPAPPTMYVPYAHCPVGGMAFEVRTASDPSLDGRRASARRCGRPTRTCR